MLKVTGLLLVVAVSTAAGFYIASGLRERQKRLAALCRFIEELGDRIRAGEELLKIIGESGPDAGVFLDGYDIRTDNSRLDKQDAELMEGFFLKLGFGDTDSQIKRCEVYRELLSGRERLARENAAKKSELYGKMGFFIGLFAAVILI